MANRKDRLESLLKREIATTVQSELRDPRIGFITITRVEMTGDLQNVTAFYTVLGEEKKRRLAAQALKKAAGYVMKSYAPHLRMRTLPRLRFAYDDQEVSRENMDDLIARARATDPDRLDPLPEGIGEQPEAKGSE